MRFLFFGNNSCPEWFLSESAVLTKIVYRLKMNIDCSQNEVGHHIYYYKYRRK